MIITWVMLYEYDRLMRYFIVCIIYIEENKRLTAQLSVHMRGPCTLHSFAAYAFTPQAPMHSRHRRHLTHHHHARREAKAPLEKRLVGDTVTAMIDGKMVSWTNQYTGGAPAGAPGVVAPAAPVAPSPPAPPAPPAIIAPAAPPVPGQWSRVSYYNAAQQVVENIVFLGNHGGQGSGVFDK